MGGVNTRMISIPLFVDFASHHLVPLRALLTKHHNHVAVVGLYMMAVTVNELDM